jgi:hypothetical protein
MEETIVRNWGNPTAQQLINTPQDHLHIATVVCQCNFLHGKVLTIIDAVFSNPAQCKAIKDLVRSAFREQIDHMVDLSDVEGSQGPSLSS